MVMAFVMGLGVAAASAGTLNPSDLVYQGYFELDQSYAGYSLAYDPGGNGGAGSLFVGGMSNAKTLREFPIGAPALVAPFPLVKELQNFNVIPINNGGAYGVAYLPKKGSQSDPKLYFSRTLDKDSMWLSLSETDGTPVLPSTPTFGYWNEAAAGPGQSLFGIDQGWADTNTAGQSLLALGHNSRYGPKLEAIAPWGWTFDEDNGADDDGKDTAEQATQVLLEYHWNNTALALQFPEGGIGAKTDQWYYGEYLRNDAGDHSVVVGGDTDAHGAVLLFYDPADLSSVIGGPQPYAQMDMSAYGGTLQGAAFDEDGDTLYVSQYRAGSDGRIHVFQLAGLDAEPVPEPAGLGLIGLALLCVKRRRR